MFADTDGELEITRTGDVLLIYPARKTDLANIVEFLRSTPPPAPLGPIERTVVRETRWDRQKGTPHAETRYGRAYRAHAAIRRSASIRS